MESQLVRVGAALAGAVLKLRVKVEVGGGRVSALSEVVLLGVAVVGHFVAFLLVFVDVLSHGVYLLAVH